MSELVYRADVLDGHGQAKTYIGLTGDTFKHLLKEFLIVLYLAPMLCFHNIEGHLLDSIYWLIVYLDGLRYLFSVS